MYVDKSELLHNKASSLHRYAESFESLGGHVAVINGGDIAYETAPGDAHLLPQLIAATALLEGNVFLWDDRGLFFRYASAPGKPPATAYAFLDTPFVIGFGYFPKNMEDILEVIGLAAVIISSLIILFVGLLLARRVLRLIIHPLEDLQLASIRVHNGNYDEPVKISGAYECVQAAKAFDTMRRQLRTDHKLREAYEANRKELIASIAHDLSTPLTKIQGYTEGLLVGVADTPAKRQHYLELVIRTSKHMKELIQQLFLFSKLELGKVSFRWDDIDLRQWLLTFVESQASLLEQQDFQLELIDEWPTRLL